LLNQGVTILLSIACRVCRIATMIWAAVSYVLGSMNAPDFDPKLSRVHPGVWAILSLMATVALTGRFVQSIVTGEVHIPIMSTIRVMDSPYVFYVSLITLALLAGLCASSFFSSWQRWKMKRRQPR